MRDLADELIQLAEEHANGQVLVRHFTAMKREGEATQDDVNEIRDAVAALGTRFHALYIRGLAEANQVRLSEASISDATQIARSTLDTYGRVAADGGIRERGSLALSS